MVELFCAGALVLLIWMLVSKYSIIRTLARIFTGLLTLVSAAAVAALFIVGQKAHWTSDGPGILLIMAGILFCGIFAFVFGGLFFNSFHRSS
jgi:hypothetical protein